jgi:hypothetical protein
VKNIAFPVYIVTLLSLLTACGNPNQRLDEYVFYDGPVFKLKVVRSYRNIPFNYLGEHAVVMCQSDNTAEFPAHDQQDAGWRMLGAGGGEGSKSAEEAALGVKNDYQVLDDHTLIATTNVFNISFDACGHFINWDPSRLPQSMIDPVDKPDSCAPNGPADCRYYDFEGDRAPHYEQIRIAGKGQVSFTARSRTFRNVELLSVHTRNNGAVWHVATTGPGMERLKPDTIHSLSMQSLEKEMPDTSLMDWFESVLPPRSVVIWPDVTTSCGNGAQTASAQCVAIHFNDIKGNNGTLYITMTTDSETGPGEASFHSAVYNPGDRSLPINSLAELGESLSTGIQ